MPNNVNATHLSASKTSSLCFLASNLAPSYSSNGYMAGSLVELTMGGWCYELPGFITSLTLDIPQESP